MEMKKLDFSETFKDAITIGVKNAPSVIAAVALFLVTIWIPYINIGTFIAITLLPTQLAKGEVINPLGIFDSKYRRYMGEFLITMGLMVIPTYIAFLFMFVPGIVLSLAWSLAYYFLIEKGKNPIEAIRASNDATYGSKWTMFAVALVFGVAAAIVMLIFSAICGMINVGFITFVVMFALIVIVMSVGMAISASYWRQLKDNVAYFPRLAKAKGRIRWMRPLLFRNRSVLIIHRNLIAVLPRTDRRVGDIGSGPSERSVQIQRNLIRIGITARPDL